MNADSSALITDSVQNAFHHIDKRLAEINDTLIAQSHNSFLGVSWDILLPTIISIFIFMLGYYLTGLQAKRKTQKNRMLVKDTITTWGDTNIERLSEFVESIKKFAININNSPVTQIPPFNYKYISLSILSQFTIDRLTDALVLGLSRKVPKKEKAEQMNNYLISVSFLNTTQNFVFDTFKEYRSTFDKLIVLWDEKWKAFLFECHKSSSSQEPGQKNHESLFYSEISQIIKSNFERKRGDADRIKAVKEMDEFFLTISTKMSTNMVNTYQAFGELRMVLNQMDNLKQYNNIFIEYAEKMEEGVERLKKSIDFYRENEIEFWR